MILLILVLTGCKSRADQDSTEAVHEPPSFVFILVDALRRDHVSLYGYPKPTTPFLDELGQSGVVFDDALSQAPQTLNSTASLFTSHSFPLLLKGVEHDPIPGVAPEQKEQWARTPRLAAANLTLAEVLQQAGYQTIALFNNPHHHATSGFGQGFDRVTLLDRDSGQAYARVGSVAAAFLDWHATRDHDRPYFAYLHLMDPHNPYRPPEKYRKLFPAGKGRYIYVNGAPEPSFNAADLETMKALYDAEIRYLDDGLRALRDELLRRGDLEDTVIVITADHGEELMDHEGLGHGKTVELEQLRIPMLLAGGPVSRTADTRIETPVRNLDLAPTIVEMAGLDTPGDFEGASLVPLFEKTASGPDAPRISYAWISRLRSLTSAEWHCTRDLATDRLKLYFRPDDPTGMSDVADDNPGMAALCLRELDLMEKLKIESEKKAAALKAVETGSRLPPESDEVLDQLEALGYVEE